ncbi:MAG: hypothetical protein HXY28_06805 [Hydrogenophilaceae bacterium]|jgi:mannose-6-phosphate isomerase-like protein (cupin superfamily)|nr:hypothetical protein [Hydrogenophilaceae bacterium]
MPATHADGAAFDLEQIHLAPDGRGGATQIPVGPDFWETIDQSPATDNSRVTAFESRADWTTWELRSDGEEILYLLSGETVIFEGLPSAPLAPDQAVIAPRGVRRTARVAKPGKVFITFGEGTQHRPRAAAP